MTPATPEGPAATREAVCEVCGRPAGRGQCERGPRYEHTGDADCYAAGYSRLRARLVEVERERGLLAQRVVELEGRSSVIGALITKNKLAEVEGAARTLREALSACREWFAEEAGDGSSPTVWKMRDICNAALAQPTPAALVPKEEDK